MSKLEQILAENPNYVFLKADGFDECVIGTKMREGVKVLHYSSKKCIEVLMEDMSEDDAIEHFEFNVVGSYVGEKTPKFKKDY